VRGSGYGDVYIRTSNSNIYFCTNPSANCNGVSAGQWSLANGGGGGTPGGTDGQVQVNAAGVFGGIPVVGTGSVLRESEVLALGSGNGRKVVSQNSGGTATQWTAINRMIPFTASNNGLDISAGKCAFRDTSDGGYFESIVIESTDGAMAFVSGSITMTFSVTTDGTAYTTLGAVSLSSESRKTDSTLSGWTTRDVAAGTNSRIRGCVTSVGTGMKQVIFAPKFRPL
jgi:hypothetical protein